MRRTLLLTATVVVVFALAMVIAGAIVGDVGAAPTCSCPQVFSPVVCPNGQVYDNSCWARCDGQRNCTYIGP